MNGLEAPTLPLALVSRLFVKFCQVRSGLRGMCQPEPMVPGLCAQQDAWRGKRSHTRSEVRRQVRSKRIIYAPARVDVGFVPSVSDAGAPRWVETDAPMQPPCQICGRSARPLKFLSEQLAICQRCITELCKAQYSPESVIESIRQAAASRQREKLERELAHLHTLYTPAPTEPADDVEKTTRLAERDVRLGEGILQSLYRSMIDESKRREEIEANAARRTAASRRAHRAAVEAHAVRQRDIDTKIAAISTSILGLTETVEFEVQQVLARAKGPGPTESKDTRILRAYFAGLINIGRTASARPKLAEYEEQKQRIRARDGYRCLRCGRGFSQGELHVHHVIPLSRFGTNEDANLVTLCHPCHNKQHPDIAVTRSFPIRRRPSTQRFIAVGIETTGLSNNDAIVEIAATQFVGNEVVGVFCSLLRSKKAVPRDLTRRTGITQSMVDDAPPPGSVMREFAEFTSNQRMVFHSASFGQRFVAKYLAYYDLTAPERVLDTLPMARKKLPTLSSHRLFDLVAHLDLQVERTHRARSASLATGLLFIALRGIGRRARRRA